MKQYRQVQNRLCEYFPCHSGIDEAEFNCMFCYCPLYGLKDACGGHFHYLENGVKDCSQCGLPHQRDGYNHIQNYKEQILALGMRDKPQKGD